MTRTYGNQNIHTSDRHEKSAPLLFVIWFLSWTCQSTQRCWRCRCLPWHFLALCPTTINSRSSSLSGATGRYRSSRQNVPLNIIITVYIIGCKCSQVVAWASCSQQLPISRRLCSDGIEVWLTHYQIVTCPDDQLSYSVLGFVSRPVIGDCLHYRQVKHFTM